jgi:monofunctional biosynthetic peptidoglycan transglycosylase
MKEAVLARRLEGKLGKRRILELYLNIIEWGEGIFGAEAAARAYFRKSAATLSEQESAHLAAMIPNPRTVYNPALHPRRVATRKVMILRRMNSVVIPRGLLGDSRS